MKRESLFAVFQYFSTTTVTVALQYAPPLVKLSSEPAIAHGLQKPRNSETTFSGSFRATRRHPVIRGTPRILERERQNSGNE